VYSLSGNDKRFPALFETALKHGYMLIHPNCRHEFLPYFEELQSAEQLQKDISFSGRPFEDARGAAERDAYAKWQEQNRRRNNEANEYTDMKAKLGDKMPYKDIGSFRRASRAKSEEYQKARVALKIVNNKDRDEYQLSQVSKILGNKAPKSLAEFQNLRYNNKNEFKVLLKEFRSEVNKLSKDEILSKIGKVDNVTARRWYHEQLKHIPDELDGRDSLEQQARQAVSARNIYKNETRDLMKDEKARKKLDEENDKADYEKLFKKNKDNGISDDDANLAVIKSSGRTRKSVDDNIQRMEELGL
jgi:hypothetical protein